MEANVLGVSANISVPSGTYTPSSQLFVTGVIKLLGEGAEQTKIQNLSGRIATISASGKLKSVILSFTGNASGSNGGKNPPPRQVELISAPMSLQQT